MERCPTFCQYKVIVINADYDVVTGHQCSRELNQLQYRKQDLMTSSLDGTALVFKNVSMKIGACSRLEMLCGMLPTL